MKINKPGESRFGALSLRLLLRVFVRQVPRLGEFKSPGNGAKNPGALEFLDNVFRTSRSSSRGRCNLADVSQITYNGRGVLIREFYLLSKVPFDFPEQQH